MAPVIRTIGIKIRLKFYIRKQGGCLLRRATSWMFYACVVCINGISETVFFGISVLLKLWMKEIKFTRESLEFVYWEGELIECLMHVLYE